MPGRLPCLTSFWDWFFIDFGSQNPPSKHPCESNYAINIKLKLPIHKNRCLPIHIEIWPHLGAIRAPFWHQKSTNVEEYSPPKGYQKIIRFWHRFLLNVGSILGALLEPCSPPRGPKRPQETLKGTQETPKRSPRGPKRNPRGTKMAPKDPKGTPKEAKWEPKAPKTRHKGTQNGAKIQ